MSINSSGRKVGWLLMLSMCASTAPAHHGGGTFDANKCFVFKGAVRQVAWANPHAWLYVQVDKPGGKSELWGFEFGTVGSLSRAGFRPSDFAQGTKVTVTAYANRAYASGDGKKRTGSAHRLILPDGRDVTGAGIAGTAPTGGPPPGAGGPPPGAGGPPPGAGGPPPGAGGPPPGAGPSQLSANCPAYK